LAINDPAGAVRVVALSDATNESCGLEDDISAYLLMKPRILRDVCRSTRGDDDGRRCPRCCVREFCEGQARRAGKLEEVGKAC